MADPVNTTPAWKSYQETGDPTDIVTSPAVASAIGSKIDAVGGQATGTQLGAPVITGGSAGGTDLGASTALSPLGKVKVTMAQLAGRQLNASDFGATGDGTTDDTAAIQAAINAAQNIASGDIATGCVVRLNPGTYLVSATLAISRPGVSLVGSGTESTVLLRETDYGDTLRVSASGTATPTAGIQGNFVEDIQLIHSATAAVAPTSGAAVAFYGAQTGGIINCLAINHYDHFAVYGGSSLSLSDNYVISYNGHPEWNGGRGVSRSCYLVGELAQAGVVIAPAKIVLSNCGANGGFLSTGYPGTETSQDFASINLSADYGYLITGAEQVELRNCQASNSKIHNLHIEVVAGQQRDILEVGVLGGYYDSAGVASVWLGGGGNNGDQAIVNPRIIGATIKSNSIGPSMDGIETDSTVRAGTYPQAVVNLIVSGNTISTHQRNGVLLGGGQNCVIGHNTIVGNNISDGSTSAFTASITASVLTVTAVTRGLVAQAMTINSLSGSPVIGAQVLPLAAGETVGGVGRYAIAYADTASTAMTGIYTQNGSALVLGPQTTGTIVNGNRLGGDWAGGANGKTLYGINIIAGATGFVIADNNVSGNTAGGITDESGIDGRYKRLSGNMGYNGGLPAAAPSVPASGTDFYNPYGTPCTVQISGGTVTAVALNGTALTGFTGGVLMLGAGDHLTLTYTAAPAWTWWPA
ncbi:hypothetical protein Geu3261_0020_009 [Komagataeibacter europaeus NBRC 3261]|uniref:Rhamnogalacturonase A/B/Epimerase-like pectate lyase domain-containing protein n=1 Tax=Komagataeibacter europaeus NBRC 3261 TaxID=1234669 RepID=A0A0D6PXX2_KOMEU|nr:glycosyl hydrolase family 28-related protein [Komagataeibacter europaeus]GAN95346.1 hypothetical protein Geu3261_0020_009 [Komagataeibacter europaeus NBRC 3261]